MDIFVQHGLNIIILVQQYRSPALDILLQAVSWLGEETFYLLVLPIVIWCSSSLAGVKLAALVLVSHYLNIFIKDAVMQPRPFYYLPWLRVVDATGYSFPSNHAQTGSLFWLGLAIYRLRTQCMLYIAMSIGVLLGFSRVYLGVHFPIDVLAGWIIAAVLLVVANYGLFGLHARTCQHTRNLIVSIVIPLSMYFIHPGKDVCAITAALAGGWFGCALLGFEKNLCCICKNVRFQSVIQLAIALALLAVVFFGLKAWLPGEKSAYYYLLRFIRYWITAFWVTAATPWLFHLVDKYDNHTSKQPKESTREDY